MTATRVRATAAAVLVSIAGLSRDAPAEHITILNLRASLDGHTWTDRVFLPRDGGRVILRASVSFVSLTPAAPLGFAGLTWQPTLSGWNDGTDAILPYADRGTNINGGSVPDVGGLNGPFGRLIPFAATGPTASDPYSGHVNVVSGVPYLRIARSSITNWVGEGASSGTNAFNNFNGSGGVHTWQKSWANVSARDPRFASDISDRAILKLGIDIGGGPARSIIFDAPLNGMSRNSATGEREASWFAGQIDNFGQIKGRVVVRPATIIVVPAPGAGIAATVVVLVATCRRRRSA